MESRRSLIATRVGSSVCLCLVLCLMGVPTANAAEAQREIEPTAVPESVEDLAALEERVASIIEKNKSATVCVRAGGGSGSGVIISEDGYVLTAGHVVSEPGRRVTFVFPDGSTARGESLGINIGIDAGLAKITQEGKWPFVEMGEMDEVKSGAWVVAMGHPGGFDIDRPIVARLGRVVRVRSTVIQTDCTIIGGDSGGPLFDLDGKVIGIHSRISENLHQNYHVPISMYDQGWDRLAAGEVWNRPATRGIRPGGPYIGVQGAQGPEQGKGAALSRVYRNSPAEKAGMRAGDIVVELDGSSVASFGDLASVVGKLEPGDQVPVEVERGGKRVKLTLEIGKAGGGE